MWYLEGFIDHERNVWRTALDRYPFCVGRRQGVDLLLSSGQISNRHAELMVRDGGVWLTDLGSTNGTFVNGHRVASSVRLDEGDHLRFARQEFRLVHIGERTSVGQTTDTVAIDTEVLPANPVALERELQRMLETHDFLIHFQPLVDLGTGDLLGFEALGRGKIGSEVIAPNALFEIAEMAGLEVELSHRLRVKALAEAPRLEGRPRIFLNTHPAELQHGAAPLLTSMARLLAGSATPWPLVLEVHEGAVVEPLSLGGLGGGLRELGVDLAFDDFGTGQARLLELAEVEPQYLKFDKIWIRGLHRATGARQGMVRHLVEMVEDLGIEMIAEGVESLEEEMACRNLGFHYAQGYHFAHPAPASSF
ncbi:MAG: EAL domain-containing protein [Acidobacteriota bacterium]